MPRQRRRPSATRAIGYEFDAEVSIEGATNRLLSAELKRDNNARELTLVVR
jgi:hypothetical protein